MNNECYLMGTPVWQKLPGLVDDDQLPFLPALPMLEGGPTSVDLGSCSNDKTSVTGRQVRTQQASLNLQQKSNHLPRDWRLNKLSLPLSLIIP